LKFKPYNIYNTNQTCKDFIQASKIYTELLFKHYSYYSGDRGVTPEPSQVERRGPEPWNMWQHRSPP
jgi:hypothetical protein